MSLLQESDEGLLLFVAARQIDCIVVGSASPRLQKVIQDFLGRRVSKDDRTGLDVYLLESGGIEVAPHLVAITGKVEGDALGEHRRITGNELGKEFEGLARRFVAVRDERQIAPGRRAARAAEPLPACPRRGRPPSAARHRSAARRAVPLRIRCRNQPREPVPSRRRYHFALLWMRARSIGRRV